MATHSATLSRRSFAFWATATGLAVAAPRHLLAQDSAEYLLSPVEYLEEQGLVVEEHSSDVASFGRVSLERRAHDGRPPSEWLRSMDGEELRAWLADIEVPEAGVAGMTFWTHLTRDHLFRPLLIKGLTEPEQAKLHAAAHFGY